MQCVMDSKQNEKDILEAYKCGIGDRCKDYFELKGKQMRTF